MCCGALELFKAHAVKHDGHRVFTVQAFEAATGVNPRAHPLFFRPEIFIGGYDWNASGWNEERNEFDMLYFTLAGLVKALAVMNAERLLQHLAVGGGA